MGTMKEKTKVEIDRSRGGKKILKAGQEWALLAKLGQLKTGLGGDDCLSSVEPQ